MPKTLPTTVLLVAFAAHAILFWDAPRQWLRARREATVTKSRGYRLAVNVGEPEVLRRLRQLEDDALVIPTSRNPKAVRVSHRPFPRSLHGLLTARPHYKPLVEGSSLRLLAVLASADWPMTLADLARKAGLHRNTVQNHMKEFVRRSIVQRRAGYSLASHVPELAQLGRFYRDHVFEQDLARYPSAYPVLKRGSRVIIQSATPIEGLQPTAAYRFQLEGADVLAYTHQYALTLGEPTGLREALEDFLTLAPATRTQAAAERFLRERAPDAS